ncbi:MAG: ABC transporter ATP-binding protein [Oscillospiraceae bacterium]|nr:ABC transporter ATP-binding protein [Oscillospiraceae bacterium]
MSDALVKVTGLTKYYGAKKALNEVNLTIEPGKIIGLLGPNGSGKTTFIKILNGLLQADAGEVLINGNKPGVITKNEVSYLPDRPYFGDWMRVSDVLNLFSDFYFDFNREHAEGMCKALGIETNAKIKTLSKGMKEKVQLILVMSRAAKLYLLDEPIAGVDPAARDMILDTILSNYHPESTVIISTHLIGDIERVLDEVIFLQEGNVVLHDTTDAIREREGKSVDALFREMFRANW